jgi:hypothetical protein
MSTVEEALGGPEIEVVAKATRRRFTLEYNLATWRAARERGELAGPAKKRGPTPVMPDPRDKQIAELERETARWRRRAERAEALVEIQKKVAALLGTPPNAAPS